VSTRDNQRKALYAWERTLGCCGGEDMSLAECQALVNRVWRRYGYGLPPEVTDGRGRRSGYGNRHRIALPRVTRNIHYVLHEVAHSLVAQHLRGVAPHGPEYARVLLGLLEEYAGVSGSKAHHKGTNQRPRRVKFSYQDHLAEFKGWSLAARRFN
jgi:hypothetical protein